MQKVFYAFVLAMGILMLAGCATHSSGSGNVHGDLPSLRVEHGERVYVTVEDKGNSSALAETIGNYIQSEKGLRRVDKKRDANFVIDVVLYPLKRKGTTTAGGMSGREGLAGGVMGAGIGSLAGGLIGGRTGALVGLASGAVLGVGAMAATSNTPSTQLTEWELAADVSIYRVGRQHSFVHVVANDKVEGMSKADVQAQLEDQIAMQIVNAFNIY